MGLSNASSKARNYSSTINQNQGGGSKKAGFPYLVGRNANSSMWIGNTRVKLEGSQSCCGLKVYQTTLVFANLSRNTGRLTAVDHWKMPGLPK